MSNITNHVKTVFTGDGTALHKTVAGVSNAVGGLKGKLAGAFGALSVAALVKSMLDFADSTAATANNLNISTDSVQRFANAAREAHISMGAFSKTLLTFDSVAKEFNGGRLGAGKKGILSSMGLTAEDMDKMKSDELMMKALENTKSMPKQQVTDMFIGLGIKPKNATQIVNNRDTILDKSKPIVAESMISQLNKMRDAFTGLRVALLTALIPAMFWAAHKLIEIGLAVTKAIDEKIEQGIDKQVMDHIADNGSSSVTKKAYVRPGQWSQANANLMESANKLGGHYSHEDIMKARYGPEWQEIEQKAKEAKATEPKSESGVIAMLEKAEKAFADILKNDAEPKKEEYHRGSGIAKDEKKAKTKAEKLGDLPTNEFMKIGGFMGANIQYRMSRLQQEANQSLTRIAEAVERVADNTEDKDEPDTSEDTDEFGST